MTIMVAAKSDEGRVFLGADTRSAQYVNDALLQITDRGKWSIGTSWAIGIAGELVAVNIVQSLKEKIDKENNIESVIQVLREGFNVPYWVLDATDKAGSVRYGFSLSITDGISIWDTDHYLGVHEVDSSFIGSGKLLAFGAWYILESQLKEMSIIPKLRLVIEAACKYDVWCGAPIEVLPFAGRNRYAC